jgi:hypothetical protein
MRQRRLLNVRYVSLADFRIMSLTFFGSYLCILWANWFKPLTLGFQLHFTLNSVKLSDVCDYRNEIHPDRSAQNINSECPSWRCWYTSGCVLEYSACLTGADKFIWIICDPQKETNYVEETPVLMFCNAQQIPHEVVEFCTRVFRTTRQCLSHYIHNIWAYIWSKVGDKDFPDVPEPWGRNWRKCFYILNVSRRGRRGNSFAEYKWLSIIEGVAQKRMATCTNIVELRNIGEYLYKVRCKRVNKISNIVRHGLGRDGWVSGF